LTLELLSERYSPVGGVSATGVLNNLGQPSMHRYELLVREALQNCWDAKRRDTRTVDVQIAHYELTDPQLDALRDDVLGGELPPDLPAADILAKSGVGILYFADFGTRGLGGPVRADEVVDETDADFADLIFNVGQPPDTDHGGGSYGFGKGAFYRRSEARVVVFHTLCTYEGRLEERLIAVGLGDVRPGAIDGARLTGRHWWGRVGDRVVSPATGDAATALAHALGLPPRRGASDLGTTVAVVAPDLEGSETSPGDLMAFLGECVAWNFWPKLIPDGDLPAGMTVRITHMGGEVAIPDPRSHPQLSGFVQAMEVLRAGSAAGDPLAHLFPIALQRPAIDIGRLVLRYSSSAAAATGDLADLSTQGARTMSRGLHHVALMRQAELIVRYQLGAAPPVAELGYTGVFRCERGVDSVFRTSEPPTHDDWRRDSAPDSRSNGILRRAFDHTRDNCKAFVAAQTPTPAVRHDGVPLGAASSALMALMPSLVGTGAARPAVARRGVATPRGKPSGTGSSADAPGSGTGPKRSRDGPVRFRLGAPSLEEDARGRVTRRVPIEVDAEVAALLSGQVRVCAGDGKLEEDPPPGWTPPPIEWHLPDGTKTIGPDCSVAASTTTLRVVAVVESADELMMVLDINIHPVSAA
jgi:hypothetical protein